MELVEKCQNVFDEMNNALTSEFSLSHFEPKLEIVVAADTMVLYTYEDSNLKAVAHALNSLLPAGISQDYHQKVKIINEPLEDKDSGVKS